MLKYALFIEYMFRKQSEQNYLKRLDTSYLLVIFRNIYQYTKKNT